MPFAALPQICRIPGAALNYQVAGGCFAFAAALDFWLERRRAWLGGSRRFGHADWTMREATL
jgi:hypothetical protein